MKLKITLGALIAGLMLSVTPASLFAQTGSGTGPKARGYGGPPQTAQERAARQAAGLEKNGGVCPKGGQAAGCPAYGGPPQTEQERAARQAACLDQNGGVCPNGGPKANCPAGGKGQGKGAGKGARKGLCDGTGPRSADGTCPLTASKSGSK